MAGEIGSSGLVYLWRPLTVDEGGNPSPVTCTNNIVDLSPPNNASGALIVCRANAGTTDMAAAIAFSETAIEDSVDNVALLRANGLTLQNNEKLLLSNKLQLQNFRMVSMDADVQQTVRVQFFTNT